MRIRFALQLLLLSLVSVLTGCSTHEVRPVVSHEVGRSISGRVAVGGHNVAIGGVVAESSMRLTEYPGDPSANAERLLELLRSAMPGRRIMADAVLSDLADPETLAAIRSRYAESGYVEPADLVSLGADLDDVGRLVMARAVGLRPHVRVRDFRATRDGAGATKLHQLGPDAGKPLMGFRDLHVTLDIWSLENGAHLWSAHTTVLDTFRTSGDLRDLAASAVQPGSRYNAAVDLALVSILQGFGDIPKQVRDRNPPRRATPSDPLR